MMNPLLPVTLFLSSLVLGLPLTGRVTNDIGPDATFDYVIVGCGVSGLVLANRLSENPDVSVLCIEAGPLDQGEPDVLYPFDLYTEVGGPYDWNIGTIPQTQLNGESRPMPAGHVVGGGSIINGMVWNRGQQDDFNAWESFSNPGWSWNDMLPYFIRSETYTPKTYASETTQPVTYDPAVHGTSGPVQVSYPNYYWTQSDNWFAALAALSVPLAADPDSGLTAGGYFLPSDINPTSQTRATARISYYDPVSSRTNLNLMPDYQVTRVLFGGGSATLHATGVEYAANSGAPLQTVSASVEVILSAGALHSPQLLQLSGIGPSAILQNAGIDVAMNLSGVGANLQDHPLVHLDYPYQNSSLTTPFTVVDRGDTPYAFQYSQSAYNTALNEYTASRTGPLTAIPSNALAFPSLPQIINNTPEFVGAASAGGRYYPAGYDSTLQAGYEAQLTSILDRLLLNTTPAFENLNNNAGGLDISAQHPLSRGTVHIASSDPFEAPVIDPRWLINPFDRQLMIAAMQFNQRILDTSPIQELMPSYGTIPQDASADDLNTILQDSVGTEYHYSCTCAMMPLELGGVVGPDLVVYGTDNLRVVDTSMFPVIPTAHLSAVAYAVAEKASDIIRGLS